MGLTVFAMSEVTAFGGGTVKIYDAMPLPEKP
jgi:hypothetical protein